MRIKKLSKPLSADGIKPTFKKFVDELELLSNRYDIAIMMTGGILIFDSATERVVYKRDYPMGDVTPKVMQK